MEVYYFVHHEMDLLSRNSDGKQSQKDHLERDQEKAYEGKVR